MRNHRVYINDKLSCGESITLDKAASHYIQTVLRLKSGYRLRIFNGDGNEYEATLSAEKKISILAIESLSRTQTKKSHRTHLVQAIARGDHMDFAIQKATELDVDIITPLIASRTQNHDKSRLEKRFAHWQSIIIHACEQSGRCYLPELKPICEFNEALNHADEDIKFICEPCDTQVEGINEQSSIALLVGPEGGFTQTEIESALALNYTPLSLGNNILRTETAATSALAIVNHLIKR